MIQNEIEGILNYQLETFKAVNSIDIKYPNKNYSPVEGTPFIKVDFLPATPFSAEIGTEALNRTFGIYQLTLNMPSGKGKYDTIQLLEALESYFKRGTVITYGGISVRITAFKSSIYVEDPVWFRQVVDINFRADLEN